MRIPYVEFFFDFGSPNAYLCHKVIPDIERRTGARFEYVPVLLGGLFKMANNRSPAESNANIPNKRAYDAKEVERFIAKHRLTDFRRNPFFPVNTLKLMRLGVAAQQLDCYASYIDEMYKCMWERGLNMADDTILRSSLVSAGFKADELLELAQAPEVKARLAANTEIAHTRGAFGSPTFFVEEEMFFGKDRLREVEEEIIRVRDMH